MIDNKRTLYIGAHPDDVYLGAGLMIARNPSDSFAITLTNGAPLSEKYPTKHGGMEFSDYRHYSTTRLREDREVMSALGLDLDAHYQNLRLADQSTHQNIPHIIEALKSFSKTYGIERLVTHQFPEAHPDHEIACFCSHQVANQLGLEVFEYPLYVIEGSQELVRHFSVPRDGEVIRIDFTDEEKSLMEKIRLLYGSQKSVTTALKAEYELFRKSKRNNSDFDSLTTYVFKHLKREEGTPKPDEIRGSIRHFLQTTQTQ